MKLSIAKDTAYLVQQLEDIEEQINKMEYHKANIATCYIRITNADADANITFTKEFSRVLVDVALASLHRSKVELITKIEGINHE